MCVPKKSRKKSSTKKKVYVKIDCVYKYIFMVETSFLENNNNNNNNNITNSRILQAAQSLMMVDGGIGGTGVDSNSNSNLNSNNHCKRLSAAIESCPSTVDENTIMPIKRNGRKKARRNSFVCIF